MNLLIRWMKKHAINANFFIPSNLLTCFLVSVSIAFIIFPKIVIAQTGNISGYVKKYADNSALKDCTVEAFTKDYEFKGSTKTNSSGYYIITSLDPTVEADPDDFYRVCARKDGYVTECYEKPDPEGCSGPDCGYYWLTNPDDPIGTPVKVKAGKTTPDVNFWLTRGSKFQGDVTGANQNFSYRIVVEGDIQYKGKRPLSWQFFLNHDAQNHYTTPGVIPPGTFTIRAEDASPTVPYYYTVYYNEKGGAYAEKYAKFYTIILDKPVTITANFSIKKGGVIKGVVGESSGGFKPIQEARVTVTEEDLGVTRSVQSNEMYTDPNTGINYLGVFIISGLPPGSYILKADDSFISEQENRIYLPEYYKNVYFKEQATPIVFTKEYLSQPNAKEIEIQITLEKSSMVRGWVLGQDSGECDPNDYISGEALNGIRIAMIPTFKAETKQAFTDPNGRYVIPRHEKILPGTYTIKAMDSSCTYFSSFYEGISVAPKSEYEINFCLENVPQGAGEMSISGHIFQDEDRNLPLSGVSIAAVNTTPTNPEFYYATTNSTGEFLFDDLSCGEYIVFTNEKYNNLILELYKDVALLDPNQFIEGKEMLGVGNLETSASMIDVFPGENITGIDISLSAYKYNFGKGLNLFGYPGTPVQDYDDSHEFCNKLGSNLKSFRWLNPESHEWYLITSSLEKYPINIRTGQGYLIYMNSKVESVFFPPFKIQPPSVYQLNPGKNFIAYPSSTHRRIKTSSNLLTTFGTPEKIANVQGYDNKSGKWKTTTWLWGKPGVADFPIVQGSGYLVEMWSYNAIESDRPFVTP